MGLCDHHCQGRGSNFSVSEKILEITKRNDIYKMIDNERATDTIAIGYKRRRSKHRTVPKNEYFYLPIDLFYERISYA